MKRQKNIPSRPAVVGIVDSPAALRVARRAKPGVDFLEWRADAFGGAAIPSLPGRRWILTARDPAEGGLGALPAPARALLLDEGLAHCDLVDIEVRNLSRFGGCVAAARANGRGVIGSFHDFRGTPGRTKLRDIAHRAADGGADLLKVALTPRTVAAIARLLDVFEVSPLPVAVMGMGPHGLASRLLCAGCGSLLNYGWLATPNVTGQWAADELSELFFRMGLR